MTRQITDGVLAADRAAGGTLADLSARGAGMDSSVQGEGADSPTGGVRTDLSAQDMGADSSARGAGEGSLTGSVGADSLTRGAGADSLTYNTADPLTRGAADSLAGGGPVDLLRNDLLADSLMRGGPDDSLRIYPGEPPFWDYAWSGAGASETAMSSADAVFGPLSSLAEPLAQSSTTTATRTAYAETPPLTGSAFYGVSVLMCFVAMCLILYLYRGYSSGIFNVLKGGATTEKMLGDQGKVFGTFLSRTIAVGLLVAGLMTLKFIDLLFADDIPALSERQSFAVISAMWGVAALIWGYGYVVLRAAGNLTLSRGFTSRLFFLKKLTFAIWTVTATPLFLIFALSGGRAAHIIGIVIVGVTALIWVFFLVRTFMLFLRHNLSILLWILYLCAVEIFPVSFASVAAYRFLA